LIKGDVIRKEKVMPKGTPAFKKLIKIGIEEHEQNGVTAPKSDAKKLPQPFVSVIQDFIFCCEIKLLKNPIAAIKTNKSRIILTES